MFAGQWRESKLENGLCTRKIDTRMVAMHTSDDMTPMLKYTAHWQTEASINIITIRMCSSRDLVEANFRGEIHPILDCWEDLTIQRGVSD